jgi:hypothetical protein
MPSVEAMGAEFSKEALKVIIREFVTEIRES